MNIDITGLDKAEILNALWWAATESPAPACRIQKPSLTPLTVSIAQRMLKRSKIFKILHGRYVPIDLTSNIAFDPTDYDEKNGDNSAYLAILGVRKCQEIRKTRY